MSAPLPAEVIRVDAAEPVATLVLCHGAWHGAWCWQDGFTDRLAARGISTIAPSLRGHAGSAAGRRLNRARMRHYADDLAAVIASLDGPVHVAGHSMGGGVVQMLLAREERPAVASATLLASMPPAGVHKVTRSIARHRTRDFLAANATWNLGRLVREDHDVRAMFFTDRTPADVVRRTRERLQSESYLGFLDMLALDRPRPRAVDEPILVVAAGDDAIFDAQDAAATARAWATSVTTVDGIGHDLMLDTGWERVADLLADWVLADR
ncbi:alpha/beta hydrolase [Nocardioides caeni]|uniref:Alpha/beta hydrolase n=1 Tax=Nocardioides caeni TaxID=574700 RepID=A0A4S8N536_9ACTN|nr:alpha/beta fold hydrolase [Nocardioides caeni]THV11233.1 alpha/beta hydrolase [Nocardioides caeni]